MAGIRDVGLPIWSSGIVPGHGVFTLIRVNSSVTAGQLRIDPGELLIADEDGCTRIPRGLDAAEVLKAAQEITERERYARALFSEPGFNMAKWKASRSP